MSTRAVCALFCAVVAVATAQPAQAQEAAREPWVTMYFAAWTHRVGESDGWVRTEDIDWDAFTQMVYFALRAESDGSVCCTDESGRMRPARVAAIVEAAHAHRKPVLIAIGGWGNYEPFRAAIRSGTRARFVSTLVEYMARWGFDGIDVDMEPIQAGDRADYIAFVRELRAAMDAHTSPMLGRPRLTAAVQWEPSIFAAIQDVMDEINLMTYDMSGRWSAQSWHNAPLRRGRTTDVSAETEVERFVAAGVDPARLGIGIDFYGYTWQGGRRADATGEGMTAPEQRWLGGSPPTVTDNVSFRDLAARYGLTGDGSTHPLYRWDPVAGAAYLSVDRPGSADDVFVSYEDARAIRDKLAFVRERGLGGVIVWELGGGFRDTAPPGERSVLLDAVRAAMEEGAPPHAPDAGAPDAGAPDDAGRPPEDAGPIASLDASTTRDAGAVRDGGPAVARTQRATELARARSAGCSAAPPSSRPGIALVLAGLALALGVRRRGRAR